MKFMITILLYLAAALAYDDINDNYHETVLNNKKLFGELFGCLVDMNPCDEFGAHAKSHLIEVLSDSCKECDFAQKHYSHTYIMKLKEDFPELYEKFEAKYDPSRKLLKKLDEEVIKFS